jgi:two-component system copper resistance phosphate regulon response regulator CusR
LRVASILVVEDESLIRHLVVDTLTDEGHSVLSAASGEDALDRLDGQQNPDLLIVDLRMPGMSGQEFVRRQRECGDSIPVVVLSGSSEAKQVGQELGAVAVIHKPFDLDELIRVVQRATDS